MAFIVFSKGHEANSKGLETGLNGWSELEGGVDKKRDSFNQRNEKQATEYQKTLHAQITIFKLSTNSEIRLHHLQKHQMFFL